MSLGAAISVRPKATTARKSLSICANAGRVWAFLLDHRRQKLLIRKLIRKQTHDRVTDAAVGPPKRRRLRRGLFSAPKGTPA